jgi:hypothetical protein
MLFGFFTSQMESNKRIKTVTTRHEIYISKSTRRLHQTKKKFKQQKLCIDRKLQKSPKKIDKPSQNSKTKLVQNRSLPSKLQDKIRLITTTLNYPKQKRY